MQKAFKEAVKFRQLNIVDFIVDELDMKIDHDCFFNFFHKFLMTCLEADMMKDEDEIEVNRNIVRYLCHASNKEVID